MKPIKRTQPTGLQSSHRLSPAQLARVRGGEGPHYIQNITEAPSEPLQFAPAPDGSRR
jgi:hypothetical protein